MNQLTLLLTRVTVRGGEIVPHFLLLLKGLREAQESWNEQMNI
jgi:hypothetical protein